jgi:hypothetical protein
MFGSKEEPDPSARHSIPEQKASPPVLATKGCTSWQMAKLELPGAHHNFADHHIRIVRPGEKSPR